MWNLTFPFTKPSNGEHKK
jgi:hypothetical protein